MVPGIRPARAPAGEAGILNARILELDVDDVPWRDELVTAVPEIADGELRIPRGPGWGVEVREDVLRARPWPRG
jgi:L-alanine-DL-glutamate epimerase-like enolase superfamily enzyme